MSKYLLILSDLFLAVLPGLQYSHLNMLKHAEQHSLLAGFYLNFFMSRTTGKSRGYYLLLLTFHRGKADSEAAPGLPGVGGEGFSVL